MGRRQFRPPARSRDAHERLAGGEDGDALILVAEIEQMVVAGGDGIGACGDGAGDDVIVGGIVRQAINGVRLV